MSYQSSVQKCIKSIATRFTACNYVFANWAQLNVELDDMKKPTICYILPPSGTLTPKYNANTYIDKPLTQIAFLAPSELDFNGERNDEVVERMKSLAKLFIQKLNESGFFDSLDDADLDYQVPYDTADDNVTGIVLTLNLSLISTIGCEITETFGWID